MFLKIMISQRYANKLIGGAPRSSFFSAKAEMTGKKQYICRINHKF